MPRRIEQEELNRLIAENASSIEINLRQLLENHDYNPDISERYFDCKILDDSVRELNFSGLNLTNSTFIDLEALSVSFVDSNLTNASIKFKSVAGTDFSRADLTRCYINKIEAMSNHFTDAIINDTMIVKKFERDGSFFSPSQAAKIISLEIAPEDFFHQIDMIRKYSSDLPQEGFCLGGGVELARHALKAIDRGETPEQISFTDKLTRKMANRSENFLKRVHDYQKQLFSHERMTIIKNKKVENNDFIAALDVKFDNSNLISCWVTYGNENEYHVFTVIKLRNSGGEVIPFPELNIAKVCAEFFNYAMISSQ